MWEVYRLTCTITGKSYVGKGNAKSRWMAHKRQAKQEHRYHLHDAIRLYGESSFILVIEATFEFNVSKRTIEKFV